MVGNVDALQQTAQFPNGPVEIVYARTQNDLKIVSIFFNFFVLKRDDMTVLLHGVIHKPRGQIFGYF